MNTLRLRVLRSATTVRVEQNRVSLVVKPNVTTLRVALAVPGARGAPGTEPDVPDLTLIFENDLI